MSRTERERYAAIQALITKHLDAATQDEDPATTILRAQLVAEVVTRNEVAHDHYKSLIGTLATVLQARIDKLQWRAWMNAPIDVQIEDESAGAW